MCGLLTTQECMLDEKIFVLVSEINLLTLPCCRNFGKAILLISPFYRWDRFGFADKTFLAMRPFWWLRWFCWQGWFGRFAYEAFWPSRLFWSSGHFANEAVLARSLLGMLMLYTQYAFRKDQATTLSCNEVIIALCPQNWWNFCTVTSDTWKSKIFLLDIMIGNLWLYLDWMSLLKWH